MKKNNRIFLFVFIFMISMLIGCGNVNENTKTENNISHTMNIKNHENIKKNNKVKKNVNVKNNVSVENKIEPKEKIKEQIIDSEKQQKEDSHKINNVKEEKKSDQKINTKDVSKEENSKSTKEDSKIIPKEETEKENNNEVEKAHKEKFTLIIAKNAKGYTGKDEEILSEKELEIQKDVNAMTYLRDNFNMKENGGFIYEIMDIHNKYPIPASEKTEEQKKNKVLGIDWFIYLNGKKTPVGANDVYPENGDELLFDIHEWDKREFLPPEE